MSLRPWLGEEAATAKFIKLTVQDLKGRKIIHTMRATDKLQALMDVYYAAVPNVGYGTGTFVFRGTRLRGSTTPAELAMKHGNSIVFFGGQVVKPEFITLKVLDQEDRRIIHKMRVTDKLQDVMDKYYAEAPDVSYGTGNFLFDGIRLRPSKTPADLKLEDGDEIDFFKFSDGGSGGQGYDDV